MFKQFNNIHFLFKKLSVAYSEKTIVHRYEKLTCYHVSYSNGNTLIEIPIKGIIDQIEVRNIHDISFSIMLKSEFHETESLDSEKSIHNINNQTLNLSNHSIKRKGKLYSRMIKHKLKNDNLNADEMFNGIEVDENEKMYIVIPCILDQFEYLEIIVRKISIFQSNNGIGEFMKEYNCDHDYKFQLE